MTISGAMAAQETFVGFSSYQLPSFGANNTAISAPQLALNQFDPSLGTLTGITIDFSGTLNGQVMMENLSRSTPTSVNFSLSQTFNVSDGSGDLWTPTTPTPMSYTKSYSLATFDGNFDWGGTSGKTDPFVLTATPETISPTDLAYYEGTGTAYLTIAGNASVNIYDPATSEYNSNIQNFASYDYAGMGVEADVTYDYSPVPEPASLSALASGLLCAIGVAVRRKKK